VRRECLDFMIPLGEKHLSKILAEWIRHYNQGRPHSSLGPEIPEPVEMCLMCLPQHGRFVEEDHEHERLVLGRYVALLYGLDCFSLGSFRWMATN
jgi:Integrase core domain